MDNFRYALVILVVMLVLYMCLICAMGIRALGDLKGTIKEQNQQIIELLQNNKE